MKKGCDHVGTRCETSPYVRATCSGSLLLQATPDEVQLKARTQYDACRRGEWAQRFDAGGREWGNQW